MSCQNENYARLSNETFKFPCPNANEIQDVNDLPNAKSCDWFDVELISVSHLIQIHLSID